MITTLDRVKNYLLIDIEEYFEPQVEEWIEDIEEELNKETGHQIIADETSSRRTFVSNGTCELLVDEFVLDDEESGDPDLLIEDEDGNELADVDVMPFNTNPKYKLSRKAGFPCGKIYVTARWGYAITPPRPLIFAATVLVAGIINQSNQHEGEVQSETIGRYTVTYKTKQEQEDFKKAQGIIKRYRRISF